MIKVNRIDGPQIKSLSIHIDKWKLKFFERFSFFSSLSRKNHLENKKSLNWIDCLYLFNICVCMCWYFCGKLISFRTHFLRLCFFRSIHHHHHRIYNLFTLHFVMKHFLFLSESWRSDDDDDDDELRKDRNLKRKRFNDFWIFFYQQEKKTKYFPLFHPIWIYRVWHFFWVIKWWIFNSKTSVYNVSIFKTKPYWSINIILWIIIQAWKRKNLFEKNTWFDPGFFSSSNTKSWNLWNTINRKIGLISHYSIRLNRKLCQHFDSIIYILHLFFLTNFYLLV